ncbi:hypothetical protein L4C34_20000 [Vibrio profundum]|uniref:hypothetical protein n=1 Tax=Vibrio profundum TaxID=2910247 RepID=UPI003D10E5D3
MSYQKNPHGEYKVKVKGRLLIAKTIGAWNVQTVEEFCDALIVESNQFHGECWGLVVDMREWELGVPEVFDKADKTLPVLHDHNLFCQALLFNSSVQKGLMSNHRSRSQGDNDRFNFFTDLSSAIDWCNAHLDALAEDQSRGNN